MVVEFYTVRGDIKESYENEETERITGRPAPFDNKEDYITEISIDMDSVEDFINGRVYFNGERLDCVYPVFYEELKGSPNLLIDYHKFKHIFEQTKGIKVMAATQFATIGQPSKSSVENDN